MRRNLSAARLLLIAGAVLAIAACSETTAPARPLSGARANDGPCLTGYVTADGRCVQDTTGGH